ncbi:MAG: sigma-70 family RNA polymerase sigma factor [Acidimicrobiales bacterium]|nr:sigma-70 family RNA polymerase sigma factor [Acidimicrobiales bacterium]
MTTHESKLRESLIAACGGEVGRDAAAEALIYGWDNWDRIGHMDNPVGYLFKVGMSRARNALSKRRPVFDPVEPARIPDVEPRLPEALAGLSERQRTVVLLTHCFQWTQSEVAELLGLSKTTVQNHLERGMGVLRRQIGDSA